MKDKNKINFTFIFRNKSNLEFDLWEEKTDKKSGNEIFDKIAFKTWKNAINDFKEYPSIICFV